VSQYIGKDLASKLETRFNLMESANRPGTWQLSPLLIPVVDTGPLLRDLRISSIVDVAVSSTGAKVVFTVPQGKRWTIRALDGGLQTGTFTINQFLVFDPALKYVAIYVEATGAATSLYTGLFYLPAGLTLPAGWTIRINVNTKAVNGTLFADVLYEEEDVY